MDKSSGTLVPTFALYGEENVAVEREYLHIEEVAARSAARNWQIDTHVHGGLLQLLFVFSGAARVMLDGVEREFEPPLAVVIPSGVIHAFKFMPRTEGYVLTLDPSGLASQSEESNRLFSVMKGQAEVIALDGDASAVAVRVRGLLEQIHAEFRTPGAASARLYIWLTRALFLLLVRERMRRLESAADDNRQAQALDRFRQLVECHHKDHWPVDRYAKALSLTPSRLNRLCLRRTGETAFALVQARLLLEARRKLTYTAMPVSELAYELGFPDPAYFSRFFRKMTGKPPSAFRAASAR